MASADCATLECQWQLHTIVQKFKWANSKNVNWPEDKMAAIIRRMITEGKVVLVEGGERRGKERKGKERETGICKERNKFV